MAYKKIKKDRAQKSFVDHVVPLTRSGETKAEHSRRKKRIKHHSKLAKTRQIKPFVLIGGIAFLIVLLSVAIGTFAFKASINDRLQLSDDSTYSSLAQDPDDGISYTLIVGEYYEQGEEYTGPDLLLLMREDSSSQNLSFLALPSNLKVSLDDGESVRLKELQVNGGDTRLIRQISDLVDVPIHHIIKIDNEGLEEIVDDLGGLLISVSEDIDDPQAGSTFIAEGTQLLDGASALTFCRATNFKLGVKTTMANQALLCSELIKSYTKKHFFDLYASIDRLSTQIETDCSFSDIRRFVREVEGAEDWNILSYVVAGSVSIDGETDIAFYHTDSTQWPLIQEAFKQGVDAASLMPAAPDIVPSDYSLTVRNGSDIAGVAKQLASTLEAEGYTIEETGNADQFVYDETLVIYEDAAMADAAEAIVDYLGIGRVVSSNGFYSFSSDILIVIGKDWKPST